jgi:hypothetical protein
VAARLHCACCGSAEHEHRAHHDFESAIELVNIGRQQRDVHAEAGVADEDVDRAGWIFQSFGDLGDIRSL